MYLNNNRKMKQGMIVLFVMLLFIQLVSAITIDIDMKESFGVGEEISLDYTILSDISQEIEYAAFVNCPDAPLALLDVKTANLEANVAFTEKYVYMSSVSEDIEPQRCNATVGILSPEVLEQKSFSIVTDPGFELEVLTCRDISCLEKTKVFVKDEEIYFNYDSGVEGVSVDGTLTYPNGKKEEVNFPGSMKIEQIGTYDLEIAASKQGYRTISKNVQFGVIAKAANIGYVSLEAKEQMIGTGKYMIFVLVGVVLVLVVFVFIILFVRLKKRRKRLGKGTSIERKLKRGLKKKERGIKKKERVLFRKLFRRKKKLPQGKKQEVDKKARQEKKVLTRQKAKVKKDFGKKLVKKKRELQKKEKKAKGQEKKSEIRRLLTKGRRQLANGNLFGAKNTYRRIRLIHRTLKPGEKNRNLYNELLTFHGRLKRKKK